MMHRVIVAVWTALLVAIAAGVWLGPGPAVGAGQRADWPRGLECREWSGGTVRCTFVW